ncbi:unnamed protein product [Linum trigynum]|uniref:Uncharacterized protein n=1 Tax=Linum trigynum TaxID=586398 RepID=A0AAV2GW72_9ROSI
MSGSTWVLKPQTTPRALQQVLLANGICTLAYSMLAILIYSDLCSGSLYTLKPRSLDLSPCDGHPRDIC